MASIQGIYLALFGRPADPAGLAYFNEITNNGQDLASIANLSGQPEYIARFTGMTDTQIVNSIYQSLFGRDAEAAGIDFFVGKLASRELSINNIAIAILDGAQGNDKATIDAKIAAADLFTTHLDLPAEQAAYSPSTVDLVKNYISGINGSKLGTATEVDAVIQAMLTSGGQAPGGGGGGGGNTGGGSTGGGNTGGGNTGGGNTGGGNDPEPTTFHVTVSNSGVLTFSGTGFNASNPVHVDVTSAGKLQFEHNGLTAELSGGQNFSALQAGVKLVAVEGLGDSQVLAFKEGTWHVAGDGKIDAADFYEALGSASNILLLDGFNVNEAYQNGWGSVPSDISQALGGALSGGLPAILNLLNFAATFVSSNTNVAVVASENADTSLNAAIQDLLGGSVTLPSWLPNIGLPVLLSGSDAHNTSATGNMGFTLVGNWDAIKAGLSSFTSIVDSTGDTLVGGKGDDVFIGLTDNGSWGITAGQTVGPNQPFKIDVSNGDVMTGGGGKDTFIHLEFKNIYSDGVDTIKDFGSDDQIVVIGNKTIITSKVDADNDGEFDDTLVSFIGSNGFDYHAGIVVLDADVYSQTILQANGVTVSLITTTPPVVDWA